MVRRVCGRGDVDSECWKKVILESTSWIDPVMINNMLRHNCSESVFGQAHKGREDISYLLRSPAMLNVLTR